ncbi:MAG TPA: branched-chain amino acid ABC transporter substrate-binding protein [Candidatus Omnitrophota bacterium]|nr:branched-chain amino acid ABC transporter substrate-binding protein [Candidatus Omnitrophota bacterium]
MRGKILILICCLLGMFSLGAKKPGVVKIGCVGPITGDQASLGLDQLHALRIAVDEANAKGEIIPGYRLEIVSLDDQHNPSQAVAMAKRLAADPDVLAVVGHVNSSCSLSAAPIYQNARMAQISPSSSNPEISRKGFDTFFRTCATDDIQAPQAAYFAFERLKAKKVFVIDDKTTYGKGIADEFEKEIRRLGSAVLGHEGIMQGEKDFTPLLTKIKGLSPDLIFFGGMYPEGALLVRQAKNLGLSSQWLGGDGIYVNSFIDLAKEDAEGIYCTFIGADVSSMESAKHYLETYTARFGRQRGPYSAYAYDAANIIIEAIRKAGKKDRSAVLAQVRATKDFPGVVGLTSFDQKGDSSIQLICVFQVRNQAFIYAVPAKE